MWKRMIRLKKLLNKQVVRLDVVSLVQGTGIRGQFEERMQQLMKELKADKNYMSLQNKLSDLEDEISNSRIKYNKDVLKYKNEIEKVPSNIIANIFKFKPELFFEIDKEEKEKETKNG